MHSDDDFNENEVEEDKHSANIKGNVLSLVRTTQRNYIDLTNIADNKAHILISINSLMLTILIPIVLSNYEIIVAKMIYVPLAILALTCLCTIVISATVLIPFSGIKQSHEIEQKRTKRSPFFFTNYSDLTLEEYKLLFQETITNKEITNQVIMSDLYYFGINLSSKYKTVRNSYKIFNIGIILTFVAFIYIIFR